MNLDYVENNSNYTEILYNAEAIANAFSEGLKQNNCLLILPMSLHQEINDAIKDIQDLEEVQNYIDNNTVVKDLDNSYTDTILDSIQESIDYSKSRCFTCTLTFPKIDFNFDLSGAIGKLKLLLDLYKDMFKLGSFDLCQAGYALRNSCLPDILKLIVLLLTAYTSIMMLKNISSISILAFIKGVISSIIKQFVSALNVSINIGGTNTQCIINALKEIAESILPTDAAIIAKLEAEDRAFLGIKSSTDKSPLYNEFTKDANTSLNNLNSDLANIDNTLARQQDNLNSTFKLVSNVLQESTDEINNYIVNLLSLKGMFEGEAKRSGTDITEVIKKVNRLIQVINLLSAVAVSIAKKDAANMACKSSDTINQLSDEQIDNVQIKDIIEEYVQQEVEIMEDEDKGIQLIIYDKPKQSLLPKISLFDCSINSFIESHTMDNIITIVNNNNSYSNYIDKSNNNLNGTNGSKSTDILYTMKVPSTDDIFNIDNIVNLLYIIPDNTVKEFDTTDNTVDTSTTESILDSILNPIGKEANALNTNINKNSGISNNSLKCRSIDDVMSIFNNIRS